MGPMGPLVWGPWLGGPRSGPCSIPFREYPWHMNPRAQGGPWGALRGPLGPYFPLGMGPQGPPGPWALFPPLWPGSYWPEGILPCAHTCVPPARPPPAHRPAWLAGWPARGGRIFDFFLFFPKWPKKVPQGPRGPGGALGALFSAIFALFSAIFGPPGGALGGALGAPLFAPICP